MTTKSICGVIIAAKKPMALADFYGKVLELKFEEEDHGGLEVHYGADIGEVHFGIHPPTNLNMDKVGHACIAIAFNVDNLEDTQQRLQELGAEQIIEPHDEGFGMTASYRDPEGNQFEIVELNYDFK